MNATGTTFLRGSFKWTWFVLVAAIFISIGLILNYRYGFLTWEGTFLSSRALLAAQGDPRSLANIGLVYPPLGYYLAALFAWTGLPHPAIWLSGIAAGFFSLWFFMRTRKAVSLNPQINKAAVIVLMGLLFLQPGFVNSAALGNTSLLYQGCLAIGIYFLLRFVLDVEIFDRSRKEGRLSAWLDSEEYQHDRLRYLWSSALAIGVGAFANFELAYALIWLIPLTFFFIPTNERRDFWKVLTVGMLLYSPLISFQLIWGYLSWIFTQDFFFVLHNPTTYFRQLDTESYARVDILHLKGNIFRIIEYLLAGTLMSFPIFYYLLWRLGSWTSAAVLLLPFWIEGVSIFFGNSLLKQDFFFFPALLSLMILLFGIRYQFFKRAEVWICMVVMMGCTALSWNSFSKSNFEEERVWAGLWDGRYDLAKYGTERKMVSELASLSQTQSVLLDERAGYALISLSDAPRLFIMPYQQKFPLYLANPEKHVDYVIIRKEKSGHRILDRVSERWENLEEGKKKSFELFKSYPPWEIWKRKKEV